MGRLWSEVFLHPLLSALCLSTQAHHRAYPQAWLSGPWAIALLWLPPPSEVGVPWAWLHSHSGALTRVCVCVERGGVCVHTVC